MELTLRERREREGTTRNASRKREGMTSNTSRKRKGTTSDVESRANEIGTGASGEGEKLRTKTRTIEI